MEKQNNKMGEKPVLSLLFSMSLPMMLSMLVQSLYNIVDSMYVSWLGTEALTAVSLAYPLQNIVTAVSVGIGVGISSALSISLGEKNQEKANETATMGMALTLVHCVLFIIFGLVVTRPFLQLFTGSPEILKNACDYTYVVLCASFGSLLQIALEKIYQGIGAMKTTMVLLATGCIINIILDPILIFGLGMGVRGAAIATVISQGASALWVFVFLTGKEALFRLTPESMKLKASLVKDITFLGTSGFVMSVTNGTVQIVCNAVLARYGGDLFLGIMTVINSVREIATLPLNGLTSGAQPVMGYNYGAGCYKRVKSSIKFITVVGVVFSLILWAVVFLEPRFFLHLFTSEQELIEKGIPALQIYFCGIFMMALQFVGQSTNVALNRPKQAVFFSLFRKVIIVVPLTILLPMVGDLGTNGVFWAEPVSNVIGGTACFAAMLVSVWPTLKENETDSSDAPSAKTR